MDSPTRSGGLCGFPVGALKTAGIIGHSVDVSVGVEWSLSPYASLVMKWQPAFQLMATETRPRKRDGHPSNGSPTPLQWFGRKHKLRRKVVVLMVALAYTGKPLGVAAAASLSETPNPKLSSEPPSSSLCVSGEQSSCKARAGDLPCLSLNSGFICLINPCDGVLQPHSVTRLLHWGLF